ALTWMVDNVGRPSGSSDTLIARRVQTAREIRRALARPIPPPPLPPITAKLAHPAETKSASRSDRKVKRIPREAWEAAYAQERSATPSTSPSYGPGGIGGW